MKKAILATTLGASLVALSGAAVADFSANVGATSNYVWRGATQTTNMGAISGGLDYSSDIGIYVGTWASDTTLGSQELDLYGGYAAEFGGFGIDVGVISYTYPQTPTGTDIDWTEVYVGLSYKMFSAQINNSSNALASGDDGLYVEVAADFDVAKDLTLGLHVGNYDFKDPASAGYEDYTDFSISLSKGEFSIYLSDTDLDAPANQLDEDLKIVVSWAKEFDLLK